MRDRHEPGVLDDARHELDWMRPNAKVRAWRSMVHGGASAIVAVPTSRDPDARGLQADNPFACLGLIDEDTRLALLERARAR